MYPLGKALPILLITLVVRALALTVHTRKGVDDSTSKNASKLNEEAFSFTHEVLLAWAPKVYDKSKPSATEAWSLNNSALNNSALALAPLHEQKRRLRSTTGTEKARLIDALLPSSDNHNASPAVRSQLVEAITNATRTRMLLDLANKTAPDERNESARVLTFVIQHVEQKQEFVAVCFSIAALILTSCCFFAWYVGSDDRSGDEKERVYGPGSPFPTQKTHTNLLAAIKCADGTWAQTYESADENGKAALELLFRCNIVRVQEFAHSRVNQEHVDECVWIAMNMLHKKPLEEWVEHWEEARKTFEDGVTACFQARAATKDARSNPVSPDCRSSASSPFRIGGYARQNSAEEALMSKDGSGENLLAVRCREIMAASRIRNTPRESRSGFRTVTTPETTPRSRPVTPRSARGTPRSTPTSQVDLRAETQPVTPPRPGSPAGVQRQASATRAK